MTNGNLKARPTVYAGVQMRSRLEADYAAYLDRCNHPWEYEPKCFAGPNGQWLPDFSHQVKPHRREPQHEGETIPIYVEVKPASFADCHLARYGAPTDVDRYLRQRDDIEDLLSRMSTTWLSEEDATLQLVFWEYGAEKPSGLILGQGELWTCYNFQVGMWNGMGQIARPSNIKFLRNALEASLDAVRAEACGDRCVRGFVPDPDRPDTYRRCPTCREHARRQAEQKASTA